MKNIFYTLCMNGNGATKPYGPPLLSGCRRKLSLSDSATPQAIFIFSDISSFTKKLTSLNQYLKAKSPDVGLIPKFALRFATGENTVCPPARSPNCYPKKVWNSLFVRLNAY